PRSGTSFRRWARELDRLARDPRTESQAPYWKEVLDGPRAPLGARELDPARDTVRTCDEHTITLSPEQTEPLLTGLALALRDWAGHDGWLVVLEGHGREEHLVAGADLARTVGWFTTEYP